MRFLNAGRHAYAARGVPCGPTICGAGWRGRMRWEVSVCWGVGWGAVARLPRAANRRWCGRCELCRCGFCRACVLCSRDAPRAVAERGGGERVWGWRAPAGRTYARRIQPETGDRGWRHRVARIAARTSSMRLRRVIWLGCHGCARSPRRGPCGYEGELSVKRVSERCDGSQVRAASSQGGAGRWR